MTPSLTRIISWGHELLAEVIRAGDLVVDLTAGNGHDTLMLARLAGSAGQVIAFDIQPGALASTRDRLANVGMSIRDHVASSTPLSRCPGIDLVHGSHARFAEVVPGQPVAVIGNLGFLPGGDKDIITRPDSTLIAISAACSALAVGGRMAIVVYPGHPGGDVEAEAVSLYCSQLDQENYQVLLVKVQNRPEAPFLLVAEKKHGVRQE